jgi:hypothetical protein
MRPISPPGHLARFPAGRSVPGKAVPDTYVSLPPVLSLPARHQRAPASEVPAVPVRCQRVPAVPASMHQQAPAVPVRCQRAHAVPVRYQRVSYQRATSGQRIYMSGSVGEGALRTYYHCNPTHPCWTRSVTDHDQCQLRAHSEPTTTATLHTHAGRGASLIMISAS